ncbi:MAG: tyrosine--tRNA ligase [Thermoplasmataceae archaeon]
MDAVETITRNMKEVITEEELRQLDIPHSTSYVGFEPSGIPHIATAVMWPLKLREIASTGMKVSVLLADWHAMINDKLGGDLDTIRMSGKIFERSMRAAGLDTNVEFIWAADIVDDGRYWLQFIQVAKHSNLARLKRALPIMGRTDEDADQDFSKYLYPLMQVNDIFYENYDVAFGGMDQRHAHMLARDIAEKMHRKKVISVHSHILGSLGGDGRMGPFAKMSKSQPDSAIFVNDSTEEIEKKINRAYCPQGITEGNPVSDILQYVIMPYFNGEVKIERPAKFGGDVIIENFEEFERLYTGGKIHPMDVKATVARYTDRMVKPIRSIFASNETMEMVEQIRSKSKPSSQ